MLINEVILHRAGLLLRWVNGSLSQSPFFHGKSMSPACSFLPEAPSNRPEYLELHTGEESTICQRREDDGVVAGKTAKVTTLAERTIQVTRFIAETFQ